MGALGTCAMGSARAPMTLRVTRSAARPTGHVLPSQPLGSEVALYERKAVISGASETADCGTHGPRGARDAGEAALRRPQAGSEPSGLTSACRSRPRPPALRQAFPPRRRKVRDRQDTLRSRLTRPPPSFGPFGASSARRSGAPRGLAPGLRRDRRSRRQCRRSRMRRRHP